jgi:ankyrin repeat protein
MIILNCFYGFFLVFSLFVCSDENGMTPLMLAVESNSPSMMKWLLEHKADPHLTSTSGWKAIHLAIRLGNESCVLLLLQEVS